MGPTSTTQLCQSNIVHAERSQSVTGLLGRHQRIKVVHGLDVAEFLTRLNNFHRVMSPQPRLRQRRQELIHGEQERLDSEAFEPKVLGNFVRNRLIGQVYLPLIGNVTNKSAASALVNAQTYKAYYY